MLLDREDVAREQQITALNTKAFSLFYLNRENLAGALSAAETWLTLAERFVGSPGQAALNNALTGVILPLINQGRRGEAEALYVRAMDLALERYPDADVTQDQILRYVSDYLAARGELERGAELLASVGTGHPQYFPSRRSRLVILRQQAEAATGGDRVASLRRVNEAARDLIDDAGDAAEVETDAERVARRRALAAGRVVLSETLMLLADAMMSEAAQSEDAGAGEPGEADVSTGEAIERLRESVDVLIGFESAFSEFPELVRSAVGQRILSRTRLFLLEGSEEALEQVESEAEQMIRRFPDQAAAVVSNVLSSLGDRSTELRQRIDAEPSRIRQQRLRAQRERIADASAELANLLQLWIDRKEEVSPGLELQVALLQAKALRVAGEAEQAVALLQPLVDDPRFAGEGLLQLEWAEALFATGDCDQRRRALRPYVRLAGALRADPQTGYPDVYWQAWTRYLQIVSACGTASQQARMPRQLDQLLGTENYTPKWLPSEPWRTELEALRRRVQ
jgi:hypothetical protein